jgi:hypothetical protein
MSKTQKNIDQRAFSFLPLVDVWALKKALSAAVKACPWSVEQIADRVSAFLGKRVSPAAIDAWKAPSKPDHWPNYAQLAAFIYATGRPEPADALLAATGLRVIGTADAELLEIAKLQEARQAIDEKLAQRITARKAGGR